MAIVLNQVPDDAQVWEIKGQKYLVYFVPKSKPPVPLIYKLNPEDYQALGKPKIKKKFKNWAQANKTGLIIAGDAEEIANETEHPFRRFLRDYEDEVKVNPMLKDPEVLAIWAEATLEGREPTSAELQNTKWWRSRSAAEREWAVTWASDPESAKRRLEDNRLRTHELLRGQGMENVSDEMARYFADRLTRGEWSEEQFRQAVRRANDPFAPGASVYAGRDVSGLRFVKKGDKYYLRDENNQDYELTSPGAIARYANMPWESFGGAGRDKGEQQVGFKEVGSVNVAGTAEDLLGGRDIDLQYDRPNVDRVRDLINQWLGPQYATGFSEEQIGRWASRITDNPDAEGELEQVLRKQRLALFPEYENENLSYEDIAAPWRALFRQMWGVEPDEVDNPFFEQIVKMNNRGHAEKMLRQQGLKDNNAMVVQSFAESLNDMVGRGAVRGQI